MRWCPTPHTETSAKNPRSQNIARFISCRLSRGNADFRHYPGARLYGRIPPLQTHDSALSTTLDRLFGSNFQQVFGYDAGLRQATHRGHASTGDIEHCASRSSRRSNHCDTFPTPMRSRLGREPAPEAVPVLQPDALERRDQGARRLIPPRNRSSGASGSSIYAAA